MIPTPKLTTKGLVSQYFHEFLGSLGCAFYDYPRLFARFCVAVTRSYERVRNSTRLICCPHLELIPTVRAGLNEEILSETFI